MKKLLIGVFVVAAAMAFSVPTASAAGDFRTNAGPFCVDFLPNFCDQVQISTDASGNTWGLWDFTCDGVTLTSAIGQAKGATIGTRMVYSSGAAFPFSTVFRFNPTAGTTNLYGTDGFSAPFSFQGDIPFNFVAGPCDFSALRAGAGSALSAR